MSLYYDTASILSSDNQKGSLKSLVYAKDSNLRSKPAHVYALISEVAKYDKFLKEVIDNAGILVHELKLNPVLALLLVHDHFFTKKGIAAAATHPLRQSIEKHKARLQSEFTRARIRRKAGSIELLKEKLIAEKGNADRPSPRWARVNTIKTSRDEVLRGSFNQYVQVDSIEDIVKPSNNRKAFYLDHNVPNLIAFHPTEELTKTEAYVNGSLILQDKASCFPAHLLLGEATGDEIGGVLDGCAAPGNKTTHAAAIVATTTANVPIYGCERDATRSKTLKMMVEKAGANNIVTVLEKQDFLALSPGDERFAGVTHLLLDPSCSGSGILGREDIPKLDLPADPRHNEAEDQSKQGSNTKKRKRDTKNTSGPEPDPASEAQPIIVDSARLEKLSNLQSLIVEHAFRFPAAKRITYSTCSIHVEENEAVVHRVLQSQIAKHRGWRVLRRDEQVEGMRIWQHRGVQTDEARDGGVQHGLTADQSEACIRCNPGDAEGTMGFFVCGFVRDGNEDLQSDDDAGNERRAANGNEDEEWEGFSDA